MEVIRMEHGCGQAEIVVHLKTSSNWCWASHLAVRVGSKTAAVRPADGRSGGGRQVGKQLEASTFMRPEFPAAPSFHLSPKNPSILLLVVLLALR
jgi:hypothetical protein